MDFVKEINQEGGKIYIIGGYVRDLVYNTIHNKNKSLNDIDLLATNIEIDKLKTILEKYGKVNEVGKSFGVIKFTHNNTKICYDVALPRTEKSFGHDYKNVEVKIESKLDIKTDCQRRDATLNALSIQIYSENDLNETKIDLKDVIDYNNGIEDIKLQQWRAIGDPKERFFEDPIRILRAIRQSIELNFSIEKNTLKAIHEMKSLLEKVISQKASVRITTEVMKTINYVNSTNIDFLIKIEEETKIFKYLELELNNLVKYRNILDKLSLKEKVYILLSPQTNKKCVDWCKKYNIFSCKLLEGITIYETLKIISMYYEKYIKAMSNDKEFLKICVEIDKSYPDKGRIMVQELQAYYVLINGKDENKFYSLLSKYPISTKLDLKVDNNELMFKYNLFGVNIRNQKDELLNEIIMDKLKNTKEDITNYLDKKYKL